MPEIGALRGEEYVRKRLKMMFVNYIEMPDLDFDFSGRWCDIRPFFGEIFYDWLYEYSHWGWVDKDSYWQFDRLSWWRWELAG
eukprot:UN05709